MDLGFASLTWHAGAAAETDVPTSASTSYTYPLVQLSTDCLFKAVTHSSYERAVA